MSDNIPLLRTIEVAATRLGVSESTIWRLIRNDKLRIAKILGRTLVPESELQRLAQPAVRDPCRSAQPAAFNEVSQTEPKSNQEAQTPMVKGSYKYL